MIGSEKGDMHHLAILNCCHIRFLSAHKYDSDSIHDMGCVDYMNVGQRGDYKCIGGDIKQHLADKVTRKTAEDLSLKKIITAKNFCIENFLYFR
jgi:hypothetical protein